MSQSLQDATRSASALEADAIAHRAARSSRSEHGSRLLRAAIVFVALLVVVAPPALAQGSAGSLRVSVKDRDFEVPLSGARVAIVEALLNLETTDEGTIVFPSVPPGVYTVTVSKPGYERIVRTGVVVTPDRLAELELALVAEVIELEELVVTGFDPLAGSEMGLLEIRATALQVQDAISAELISRAGASDVAGALKLVVGTSLVDGKYATVRGLSDRYTGTTLNGVRVPSADPRRRAVQVDLFPSGTLDSVTVNKTFTPDLQGDFTGGGVDIHTKSIPEERLLSVSLSTEFDEGATGNEDFLTYEGGGVDRAGFSRDDARELPDIDTNELPPVPRAGPRPSQASIDAARAWDEFTNAFVPVMGVSRAAPEWNHGFSLTAGNSFRTEKGRVFGLLGALTYSHSYDYFEDGVNNQIGKGPGDPQLFAVKARSDSSGTDEVLVGFLGSAEFRPTERHGLSLKVIANQAAEDSARVQIENLGGTSSEVNQSLRYVERTVVSVQLHGDHEFPELFSFGKGEQDLFVKWVGSANFTRQDEPDLRFFRYEFDSLNQSGNTPGNSTSSQNTRRFFSDIVERNEQFAADARLEFLQWAGLESEIKIGVYGETSDREYEEASFTYEAPFVYGPPASSAANPTIREIRGWLRGYTAVYPGQFWTDVFTEARRLGLAEVVCSPGQDPFRNPCASANQLVWYLSPTGTDVNYTGDQEITAVYGMATIALTERLKVVAGARRETTEIAIRPFSPAGRDLLFIETDTDGNRRESTRPAGDLATSISEQAILPAFSMSYELRPEMNVRASWSKTIARPTFRELAPVATDEFARGDRFLGNPFLKLSDIENYDLRWEWFPQQGDVLAFSVFYKTLENPIEYISFASINQSYVQPVNYKSGRLKGVEIEARSELDRLWGRLGGFAAGFNATWLESEVDVPRDEQDSLADFDLDVETRRLLGQPEFLINASLTYDNEAWGFSAGLFYNLTGEILTTGAARGTNQGTPDTLTAEYATLDLTFKQDLSKGLALSGKLRNILAENRETLGRGADGGELLRTSRDTLPRYSLSLSYKW